MKLLRDDLIIYPDDNNNKFIVKDPANDEVYEFGEKEHFVIEALKTPYNERVLLAKFNTKFDDQAEISYINDLISQLDDWGLLKGNGETDTFGENEKPAASREKEETREKGMWVNHWSLFCPERMLDLIVAKLGFLRHFVAFIPILLLIAVFASVKNYHLLKEDMTMVSLIFGRIDHIIFTLFTINLFVVLVKGSVARRYKIDTPSFGIMIVFGIIPRFNIPFKVNGSLDRKAKLWLYGASHLVRITLISSGIIIWLTTRHLGTSISTIGIALAFYSVISFLIFANPLLGTDGYRLFETYFNAPNFRQRAKRSLRYLFFKPPEVITRYTEDSLALKAYAALSLLFTTSIVVVLSYRIASQLEFNYQGFGVAVSFLLAIYIFGFFRMLSKKRKKMMEDRLSKLLQKTDTSNGVGAHKFSNKEDLITIPIKDDLKIFKRKKKVNYRKWLKYFLFGLFIVILFLPYKYEPGGEALVLPILHQEIFFDKKGIIQNVYYDGGELVEKGTVVAEMENYKQKADVDITRSEIQKKMAEINILLTTPSKEEVELAKKQVYAAKLQLEYSFDDFSRIKELHNKDVVSLSAYLDAKEKVDLDKQDYLLKEANLLVVQNQVNKHQLESKKIELTILQRELELKEEELEKTKLRMPCNGKIITMNLKNFENKFLNDGELFAEVEDSSRVQIEISIPEADANQISVGDKITFRPLLHPTKSIIGNVASIYPVTQSTTYGKILKVMSLIPNEDFILKTGMTGHAKVEGEEMFVFQAFTRAIVSFALIEFWSWLP